MIDNISPNTESAAPDNNAVASLESIAAKMTAMREQTQQAILRNQNAVTDRKSTRLNSSH